MWNSPKTVEHLTYAARDAAFTARVYRGLRADAGTDARIKKLYDIHLELAHIVARMHSKGVFVHQANWDRLCADTAAAVEVRKRELLILVGDPKFQPSPQGFAALLFARHAKPGRKCFGLPDPVDDRLYTDDTQQSISVNAKCLILLRATTDIPLEVLEVMAAWGRYQKELKRLGYLNSKLLKEALGPDGRLRPQWNSCGTDTMRLSCSAPNVMNIEKPLRAILAPPPDHVIVHADKKQLEIRVMEVVAADDALGEAIRSGDLYSAEACAYFGKDLATFNPKDNIADYEIRQSAKTIRLARQYGAGKQTVFMQALIRDPRFTFNAVNALMAKFDRRYWRTVEYWKEETARVAKCGYSEGRLLFGRREYARQPELSETVNYPVQRTAAEMMNLETLELDKRLRAETKTATLIMQLHDALDVECHESEEEKVCKIVTEVMDREWTFCDTTRRFPIDLKVTRARENGTWADV